MKYTKVFVETIGYELPPIVVTSAELEARLAPVYEALHFQPGQLEALTGISERRFWASDTPLSQSAITAAHAALDASAVTPSDIDVLIYAGVCRESFEPATACRVANGVGVSPGAAVYDISNACLGVLNGMLDIANRIELGQIRAGLVVSCESAREIGGYYDRPADCRAGHGALQDVPGHPHRRLRGRSGASDRRLLRLRRLHPLRVEAPPPGRGNAHRA